MTPAKKKRKPGRPPKMRDGRRINLYLPQAVVDRLEKLGDGNVSLGVVRAVERCGELPERNRRAAKIPDENPGRL